jgi:hypothetical protein
MQQRPQLRMLFLVFACCLLFLSPLIIVMGPLFIPMTFYFEKNAWFYYSPSINYYLFAGVVVLLIAACLIILIGKMKWWAITLSILLTIGAIVCVYGSATSYFKMTASGVTFSLPFSTEKNVYKWSQMEQFDYYSIDDNDTGRSYMIIYFKDGNSYQLSETAQIEGARSSMNAMFRANNVTIKYIDISDKENNMQVE